MKRRIALCADDHGYNDSIDAAILALIDRGRLGGASCMVQGPSFPRSAPALRERNERADIGLHFNLTESFADVPRMGPLPAVIVRSWLRAIDRVDVAARLARQLDRFESAFGCAPDYIDGHQHVHQFPVIRDALLHGLASRYGARRPLIRTTVTAGGDAKAGVIELLGGRALQARLRAGGWPTNADFIGAYAYGRGRDFDALSRHWLRTARNGAIWMCHPATRAERDDPIGADRVAEFELLGSARFDALRAEAGVELVRPRELSPELRA